MNLCVEQLSFAYRHGTPVLREVSVEIRAGRVTGFFGPNGSGKSTLLRCLNRSLRPQSGTVRLGGKDVAKFAPREIARLVAVVSQDTPVALPFTALEVVLLGRYPHGELWQADSPADVRLARECLAQMDAAALADRPFDTLSGGERQRVIVARALAQRTPVLLWDEPAAHLDIKHQIELYRLARGLAAEGRTVVMVCHDLVIAPLFMDHAVLLHQGGIEMAGPAAESLSPERIHKVFGVMARFDWAGKYQAGVTLPK
jgi:iron complex transport system ATP-binding protein